MNHLASGCGDEANYYSKLIIIHGFLKQFCSSMEFLFDREVVDQVTHSCSWELQQMDELSPSKIISGILIKSQTFSCLNLGDSLWLEIIKDLLCLIRNSKELMLLIASWAFVGSDLTL